MNGHRVEFERGLGELIQLADHLRGARLDQDSDGLTTAQEVRLENAALGLSQPDAGEQQDSDRLDSDAGAMGASQRRIYLVGVPPVVRPEPRWRARRER